jgi:hypothetical protein
VAWQRKSSPSLYDFRSGSRGMRTLSLGESVDLPERPAIKVHRRCHSGL